MTFENFNPGLELRGSYLLASWNPLASGDLGVGWLFRDTNVPWSVPGASGVGTDLVAGTGFVVSGFAGLGADTVSVTLDPAVVQTWAANPAANQGVLLVNGASNVIARLYAPWHTNVAFHPELTLVYQPGIPPGVAQAA